MIWKCQTVTGIFNRNNGTNATQKQKPQTIKSKLVVWDFCFCRIYFLSCAWHTGGAGRGNGYASSGVLPENPGNAGSESRAESAFPSGLHIIPTKAMSARLPITLLTGIPSRILPWWISKTRNHSIHVPKGQLLRQLHYGNLLRQTEKWNVLWIWKGLSLLSSLLQGDCRVYWLLQ